MESHKWTKAVTLLRKEAQKHYAAHFSGIRVGEYSQAQESYNDYVALNAAAQYLELHPGSGELTANPS